MNHLASIWHSPRFYRAARLGLVAALVALALAQPAFAQDLDISTKSASALTTITVGIKVILTVAVMGSGVLASFGRMTWSTVGQVVIGTMIAGLATEVVAAFFDE